VYIPKLLRGTEPSCIFKKETWAQLSVFATKYWGEYLDTNENFTSKTEFT